jgi:hypothetical protein
VALNKDAKLPTPDITVVARSGRFGHYVLVPRNLIWAKDQHKEWADKRSANRH